MSEESGTPSFREQAMERMASEREAAPVEPAPEHVPGEAPEEIGTPDPVTDMAEVDEQSKWKLRLQRQRKLSTNLTMRHPTMMILMSIGRSATRIFSPVHALNADPGGPRQKWLRG